MSQKPDLLQEKIREAHERVQQEIAKTSDTVSRGIDRMREHLRQATEPRQRISQSNLKAVR